MYGFTTRSKSTARRLRHLAFKLHNAVSKLQLPSTAFFHVDQEPTANVSSALSYQCTYEVRDKHDSAIGKLALNQELRESRPGQIEFIMLAISNISYLHVMAIEWVDDIAQRLQVLDRPVAQEMWMAAYPHRKLIVLG